MDEARRNPGEPVVYTPRDGAREDGTIIRCSETYVFVDYGRGQVKATNPGDLEFLRSERERS